MAIDFPNTPTLNQTYTVDSKTWIYDGEKWLAYSPSVTSDLDNLSDTVITSPEEFQSLVYDGTNWVNKHASVVSYVRNVESTTLTTGTVVYLFGATGDHATVKRADNDSDNTSSKTVGLVAAPIAASQNGPVVTRGYVDGINLSVGYSPGDVLWLADDGAFTKTKPVSPKHLVFVGVVVRATNNGIVYVATQNGYELDELHDVSITDKTSGDFLKYNGTLWVNDPINLGTDTVGNYMSNVTAGNLITVTHTPGEGSSAEIAVTSGTSGQIIVASAAGVPTWVTESGDITIDASGVTSITSNVIVNADISTAAAISLSKLASGTSGQMIVANASGVPTWVSESGDITIDASGVTSITSNVIVNADISTAAAIAHNKLANATAGQILLGTTTTGVVTATTVTGDVTITGAGVTAIASNTIVNADINSAAAISLSKLASGSSAQVVLGNATGVPTFTTISGDIAVSNTGVVTIQANSVALGTDTTGDYISSLVAGTGVTLSNNSGESATPTISIGQPVGTTNNVTFNDLIVSGNLTVNGTTTTINSTTLNVDDINIELGSVASPTDVTAAGGGITLKGATDKTITWNASNGWSSSEDLNIASGKIYRINGTSVLSSTTLGSGVTGSSLTSVGTIATGVWQGTLISSTYGGTGVNNGGRTITLNTGNLTLTAQAAGSSVTVPSTGTLATTGDTTYIGTTAVTLSRASANLALTGISSVTLPGATSGTVQLIPTAAVGTGTVLTIPATTGTIITTGDTGTVSNAMLAGSIATSKITGLATSATTDTSNATNITSGTLPNARLSSIPNSALANTSVTINGTAISLGSSGTITANAATLTGTSLNSSVVGSSLTSVGTLTSLTVSGNVAVTGSVVDHVITNSQTGTSYTLVLADDGKFIEIGNTSNITLTIPADNTVNFPVGTSIDILQTNTGQIIIASASGVTTNSSPGTVSNATSGPKTRTRWSSATLIKRAANTWVAVGDLSA